MRPAPLVRKKQSRTPAANSCGGTGGSSRQGTGVKKTGAPGSESQIKSLEESKKRLDDSVKVKKQQQDEKQKKMIAVFKKMRPEQAGQLMDKLEEEKAIFLLNKWIPKQYQNWFLT